jgi:DNA-binding transcriptional regulator YhcF (GntR family)
MAAHPYQELAYSIMETIERGELPPGTKLPSVRALARDHDVSAMTAQKALSQLAHDGYAESVAGLGYFAKKPPENLAADDAGESLADVAQQLRQLQAEVRALADRLEDLEQKSAD